MRRLGAIVLFACALATGCKRGDDGTSPKSHSLPELVLKDDTPNLLLTWIDEKGDFHTTEKVGDVPPNGRDAVRVVVTNKDEGAATDLVYVADLRQKKPDGTYAVRTMTRAAWEDVAEKRRAGKIAQVAPHATATGPQPDVPKGEPTAPAPNGKITAIIYGASWCGPCHDAQAYLKRKGVTVVYHDIEEEPAAAHEMSKKLARAGMNGGGIPVIDIAGRLMVGFEPHALDAAISAAERDTTTLLCGLGRSQEDAKARRGGWFGPCCLLA